MKCGGVAAARISGENMRARCAAFSLFFFHHFKVMSCAPCCCAAQGGRVRHGTRASEADAPRCLSGRSLHRPESIAAINRANIRHHFMGQPCSNSSCSRRVNRLSRPKTLHGASPGHVLNASAPPSRLRSPRRQSIVITRVRPRPPSSLLLLTSLLAHRLFPPAEMHHATAAPCPRSRS